MLKLSSKLLKRSNKDLKKIFFLHFAKCGGTSIDIAIQNSFSYYEKQNIFHLDPQASLKASEVAGDELMDYREKIMLYYMSRNNCKYISGHFNYSKKAYLEFGKEWHFITILRDPVAKWFSNYFYDKYKKSTHCRIDTNVTIENFLESERGIDLGCDYVSKLTTLPEKADYTSKEAIEEALNNLRNFSLVGVIEDTKNFTQKYHNLFGSKISIAKANTNPLSKAKQQEEITDKIRSKVEKICQPNMKIYKSVLKQLNDEQIS